MANPTLAEILDEQARLEEEARIASLNYPNEPILHGYVHINLSAFYRKHGPALAAVARAGMKMRGNGFLRHDERCRIWEIGAPECTCGLLAVIAAWDAAARGGTGR